jgi:hypothetical protein
MLLGSIAIAATIIYFWPGFTDLAQELFTSPKPLLYRTFGIALLMLQLCLLLLLSAVLGYSLFLIGAGMRQKWFAPLVIIVVLSSYVPIVMLARSFASLVLPFELRWRIGELYSPVALYTYRFPDDAANDVVTIAAIVAYTILVCSAVHFLSKRARI